MLKFIIFVFILVIACVNSYKVYDISESKDEAYYHSFSTIKNITFSFLFVSDDPSLDITSVELYRSSYSISGDTKFYQFTSVVEVNKFNTFTLTIVGQSGILETISREYNTTYDTNFSFNQTLIRTSYNGVPIIYLSLNIIGNRPFIFINNINLSTGFAYTFIKQITDSNSKNTLLFKLSPSYDTTMSSMLTFGISINTKPLVLDDIRVFNGGVGFTSKQYFYPSAGSFAYYKSLYSIVETSDNFDQAPILFQYENDPVSLRVYGNGMENTTYFFLTKSVQGKSLLASKSFNNDVPINIDSLSFSMGPPISPSCPNPTPVISYSTVPNSLLIYSDYVTSIPNFPAEYEFLEKDKVNTIKFKEFPYGWVNGKQDDNTRSLSTIVSQYKSTSISYNFNCNPYDTTASLPGPVDVLPPKIIWFKTSFNIDSRQVQAQVSDDLSGFLILTYKDIDGREYPIIDSSNLLIGSNGNGTFIKNLSLYSKENLLLSKQGILVAYDYAGNTFQLNYYPIVNSETNLKSFNVYNNITSLYFKYNSIQLNGSNVVNSLYITLLNPISSPILLYLNTSLTLPTLISKAVDLKTNNNMYSIDFTIPKSLVGNSNSLEYLLMVGDITIESYKLIGTFGQNASLSIQSNSESYADEMPPLIDAVTPYPNIINTYPSYSSPITVGFIIKIKDQVNGFKNGTIKITSNFDLRGITRYITPLDSISNNQFLGEYNISFQVFSCNSDDQVYSISYVELYDNDGYHSSTDSLVDPLMKLYDETGRPPSVTIRCDSTSPEISKVPSITNLVLDREWVNFNSLTRVVNIEFNVTMISSGPIHQVLEKDIPIIYFETINGIDYETCTPSFTKLDKIFQYKCTHEFKMGFGFNRLVSISVYGMGSTLYFYSGYSPMLLKAASLPYFIYSNVSSTNNPPFIEVIEPIKSNETLLSISGLNFYFDNIANIQIDYSTDSNGFISNIETVHKQTPDYVILDLPFPSFYSFKIRIINNNNIVSNEYQVNPIQILTQTPATPRVCYTDSDCSGHGICLKSNGTCECDSQWTGKDCSLKIIVILPPKPNQTDPTVPIDYVDDVPGKGTVSIKSFISVVGIKEINYKGKTVFSYTFPQWTYLSKDEENSTKQYEYNSTIVKNGNSSNINVLMEWFSERTIVYFANSKIEMNPSTIKYTIKMDKYQFDSPLNTLQLLFRASIQQTSEQNTCSLVQIGKEDSETDYIKLQVNEHSLYGRFIKRAIIDNQIKSVSTEIVQNQNSRNDQAETLIAIKIPSYYNNIIIDPDFGLLVDTKNLSEDKENVVCKEESNQKRSLSNAQIAGIVVSIVAFITAFSLGVAYYIYRKRRYNKALASAESKLKIFSF